MSYPQNANLLQKALGARDVTRHFVGRSAFHHTPYNKGIKVPCRLVFSPRVPLWRLALSNLLLGSFYISLPYGYQLGLYQLSQGLFKAFTQLRPFPVYGILCPREKQEFSIILCISFFNTLHHFQKNSRQQKVRTTRRVERKMPWFFLSSRPLLISPTI